jgi:membrane protein DedA with SNARE-associated domain
MDQNAITELILNYRYWILIPLSFAEGPIIAFIAGTLASVGYFNVYVLGAFFIARDIIVDLAMYAVGYWGSKTKFFEKVMRRFKITTREMEDVEHLWNKNAGKTMFFSKLSYGVAAAFVMLAGVVEMPLKKFIFYGALVACAQYGVLLVLGYTLGTSFGGSVSRILDHIQYVLAGGALILTSVYVFKWYMRKKLRQAEEKEEGIADSAKRS